MRNSLIILSAVLLALGPVVLDQYRAEVARWYLADATNRVVAQLPSAEQVELASKWVPDIRSLRDYWLYRAEEAYAQSPEAVSSVIDAAVRYNPTNLYLGSIYSTRMAERSQFEEAVAVIKASRFGPPTAESLNQLAYFRALAAVELDAALEDINQALEIPQDGTLFEAMLRDTRAWVLFQMGRPQEAIDDIDYAIEVITKFEPSGMIDQTLEWLLAKVNGPVEPRSSDQLLTQREAGEWLWTVGTLRYHRAKIQEALGKTEESKADLLWLREHRLPQDDRLF